MHVVRQFSDTFVHPELFLKPESPPARRLKSRHFSNLEAASQFYLQALVILVYVDPTGPWARHRSPSYSAL